MAYLEKDFEKCRFNPLKRNLFKAYPELGNLSNDPNYNESIARFIIITYDPGSPVIKKYRELKQRKVAACELAEITDANLISQLHELSVSFVVEAIDVYLKNYAKSMLWYMISANEQTFFEYGKRMMEPIKDAESREKDLISAIATKSKLSEDMETIYERVKKGYNELYDDDVLQEKATSAFKPESYATRV